MDWTALALLVLGVLLTFVVTRHYYVHVANAANSRPSSESAETRAAGQSFDLHNHVVLFLDVLGQKDEILKFQLVPDDEEFATKTVLETAGLVSHLRGVAFTLLDKQDAESDFMKELPETERKKLKELTRSQVVSQALSDALVFSVPIGPVGSDMWDEHSSSMNGIRWTLVASCWIQLRALASGHPVRGGLDIGWGVKLSPSEIYGAAFVKAYELESSKAEYPRVVCGAELLRYLDVVQQQTPESDFGRNAVNAASHCRSYLFKDDGGLVAVDFLGEGFHEGAQTVPGIEAMISDAYRFVLQELDRFSADGPDKLAKRYRRLSSYFESRLHLWGVAGDS